MSDGSLSQDEIDALLQGSGGFDLPGEDMGAEPIPMNVAGPDLGAFSAFMQEIADAQANNLSTLVGTGVSIGAPAIEVISNGTFVASLPAEVVQIVSNYSGDASGRHSYLFSPDIATTVAGLMMGQEGIELNEAALSALEEAGNMLSGTEATSMSDKLGLDVSSEPGTSRTAAAENVEVPDGEFAKVTFPVIIEGHEAAELIEIFDMALVRSMSGGAVETPSPAPAMDAGGLFDTGGADDSSLFGGMMNQPAGGMMAAPGNPNVQAVQFPTLGESVPGADQGNIGLLMDVYMEMTVELGRTRKLIRDILGMGEGTIIELDKLAGEPVDILVNHKLIAKGEVVVIDENFGVRVTEIVDPMDRVSEM